MKKHNALGPWVWPTLAVTVTTRTITFLVGDLYQPLFTFTFHCWEGHPKSFVGASSHQGGWIGYYLHHAVHPVQLPETSWFMILLYSNWISTFWLGLQSPKLSKTYLASEKWLEENDSFLWRNFFRGNVPIVLFGGFCNSDDLNIATPMNGMVGARSLIVRWKHSRIF